MVYLRCHYLISLLFSLRYRHRPLHDENTPVAAVHALVTQLIYGALGEIYTEATYGPIFKRVVDALGHTRLGRIVWYRRVFDRHHKALIINVSAKVYHTGQARFLVTICDHIGGKLIYSQPQTISRLAVQPGRL